MPSPDQLRVLETQIAPAALASERATGIPAEISCAQCVLESGWLQSVPAGSRNPFGIKATSSVDPRVLAPTREWFNAPELWTFLLRGDKRSAQLDPAAATAAVNGRRKFIVQDWFAAYPTLGDAFTAHANLLLRGAPYEAAVKQYAADGNLLALIRGIAQHYATDPHYAEQLEEIALSKEVTAIMERLRKVVIA